MLIHYHRDEQTGKHIRHIHYRQNEQRSPKTQRNKFAKEINRTVNKNNAYKVPNVKRKNEQQEAQLALHLRTLLRGAKKNRNNKTNRNFKNNITNVRFGKATTRITRNHNHRALPTGLQFLKKKMKPKKKTLKSRNDAPVQKIKDVSVKTTEATVPASGKEETLSMAYLLSDFSHIQDGHVHEHTHHGHHHHHDNLPGASEHHSHAKKNNHAVVINNKLQSKVVTKKPPMIAVQVSTSSPHTIPARSLYEKSTIHARPITKRGVIDSDIRKSIMHHKLRIEIKNTSPSTPVVTKETRYGGLASTRILRQQIEPLSGIDLVGVRKRNRNKQKMPAALKASLAKPVSPSELVHFSGIHVMISNGKQDKSPKIPTLHLTASVTDKANIDSNKNKTGENTNSTNMDPKANTENSDTVQQKIVGTAVVRNGHLYLVLYPFGSNTSLELRYNKTVDRIKLPRNKPVPFSAINKLMPSSTPRPTTTTTTSASTTTTAILDLCNLLADFTDPQPLSETHQSHSHKDMHGHSHSHGRHDHHQNVSPCKSLTMSETIDKMTTVNRNLAPVKRFMSPWNSLNFSEVLPYPVYKKSNSSKGNEEEDVDIVTFVANATDPFEKIKTILEALSNNSSGNVSDNSIRTAETKFNFEVKLKTKTVQNDQGPKPSATNTVNENNSEEVRTMDSTTKETTTLSSVGYDTTEPLVKSTIMPSMGSDFFGQNSKTTDSSDASTNNPIFNAKLNTIKHKVGTTSDGGTRPFDSETVTQSGTENPDGFDLLTSTPVTTFKTNTMETKRDKKTTTSMKDYTAPNVLPDVTDNIISSTIRSVNAKRTYEPPQTTLTYFPKYTFTPNFSRNNNRLTTPETRERNTLAFDNFDNTNIQGHSGSQYQPFVSRTSPIRQQQSPSRPPEKTFSLADILKNIKKMQMHNMHNINARKNNFERNVPSETQPRRQLHAPIVLEGPVFKETSTRYSDIPMADRSQHRLHNFVTPDPMLVSSQWKQDQELRRTLDAMLVLSVDDILAEHTSLHGALVMSQRRDSSSSNNK